MAVKNAEARRGRGTVWGVVSVVCFILSVALIYLIITQPAAPGGLIGVVRGLGGSLSLLLPVVALYAGIGSTRRALGKGGSVLRGIADGCLILLLFAAVHIFFAAQIKAGMGLTNYANFIHFSYSGQTGGGAIGAILAWPAFANLGVGLGFTVILLLMALELAVTGRFRWLFDLLQNSSDEESPALPQRKLRGTEHMYENDSLPGDGDVPPYLSRDPRPAAPRPARKVSERDRERQLYNQTVPAEGRRGARTPAQAAPVRRNSGGEYPSALTIPVPKPGKKPSARGGVLGADAFLNAQTVPGTQERKPAPAEKESASSGKGGAPIQEKTPAPAGKDDLFDVADEYRIEPEAYEAKEQPKPAPQPKKPSPASTGKKAAPAGETGDYDSFPPIDLLAGGNVREVKINRNADMDKARLLESTLKSFGIDAHLTGIAHGPAVTRYELAPAPGIKVSRITALSDDIALNLAARSVRIEAPIPGKAAVGVEIPNDEIETVCLRDVLESPEAISHPSRIAVGLGKDNSGRYIVADIAKMPHVLIAGQTGSGKSVCINAIIISILYRATPKEVQLILIDPKVVELSVYNNIPHLITPVVTDPKKAAGALDWAVAEMGRRYKKFADREVRDIKGYNKKLQDGEEPMPQIVIIIDELADLMMVVPGDVEDSICRLAQLARAAGMHLVIATQRPSVNVVTGIIKANIPSRIAFSVASQVDSRTMIDHGGAEKLLGNGDMLYVPSGINKPMRVQGSWVSDDEVRRVVEFVCTREEPNYDQDLLEHMNKENMSDAEKEDADNEFDPRLAEAVEIVVDAGQASTSMLQRRMRVGYARAGRLIDEMELRGIVGEANGAKPREVLISREEFRQMFSEDSADGSND